MDLNTSVDKNGIAVAAEETSPSQLQAPYRFNHDELRVLKQCNKESFYQRSLPISTVLSIGTYYAVKSGYLKNHPRFGPTPKVIIAATVGYFIGKFSYQSKCAEKLMLLPNSPIGEMLRQRRRQTGHQEIFPEQSSLSWPETESTGSASQIVDIDPPMGDGFDTYRPLDDLTFEEDTILTVPTHLTSYEELRRKNREEYEHKRPKPFRSLPSEETFAPSVSTPIDNDSSPTQKNARNKYGDVWSS